MKRITLLALAAGMFVGCETATAPSLDVTAAANPTSYSGRATAVRATVLNTPITLVDVTLQSTGGAEEASLVDLSVPPTPPPPFASLFQLSAEVGHASTIGKGNKSSAEASLATVNTTVAGVPISAQFVMARAEASCNGGTASVSGSSQLVDLVINGQPIVVAGTPNQTVSIPGGQVVINEQTSSASGNSGEITVNALHIVVNGVADVIVASAHADILCKNCNADDKDFVTGGGWIVRPSGAKANFGVAGGIKNGAFWGHLMYIDHGGPKVKGTGVTAYDVTGSTSRHIEGTAEVNGQSGYTYKVDVTDNGEPGREDTFSITVSNGYSASGTLSGGGNIQLHKPSGCP